MTQREDVIEYIIKNGHITRAEAWSDLGIAELPARICELKAEGYKFKQKRIPFVSRLGKKSSFIEYSLEA